MKRKAIINTLMIGCLLLLSACQEVPEKVKENIKQYGGNEYKNEKEISYCPVDSIRDISMKDIIAEEKNITFPSSVDFSKVEEVGELTLKYRSDYSKLISNYSEYFGISSNASTESKGALDGDTGRLIDNISDKEYLYIGDNGIISYLSPFFYDCENIASSTNQTKKYYFKRQDVTDASINFISGKINLTEEVQYVEKEVKKFFDGMEEFDTEVRSVHILEHNDNSEYALFNLQLAYKGVILDFYGGGAEVNEMGQGVVTNIDNSINIGLNDKNKIGLFSSNGILDIDNFKKTEKIIDFQSAVNIFEHEMSSFNQVNVCEIEPVYMLEPIYDSGNGSFYAKSGNKVKAIPVYSFLISFGDDDSEIGIQEGNELVYFNVNMLTGEIYTNFEARGYAMSEGIN